MFSHIVLHLTKLIQNVCLLIWLLFCLFVRFLTYYYTFIFMYIKIKVSNCNKSKYERISSN